MRTKVTETVVYKFSELTEEAQDKAIQNLSDINVDFEWWDGVYEDAKTAGIKITEFDLDRNRHAKGNFIDGALESADKIIANHGEETETYKTAKQFLSDRDELVKKYSDGVDTSRVAEDKEYEFDQDCDELETEFLRSILEDYSIMLEKEYEYLTGREAIIETINANEYEFTENGKIA